MFDSFDFSILDDPDFKEDSVREELIVPFIKSLGYKLTGDSKIVRSKSLVHPYVSIGSKQRKVSITPDYVFYSDDKPYWILDAKAPNEKIEKSKHVEQAYSYAIHPEIRAEFYALCNGREFALYEVRKFEPIILFKLEEISAHWDSLYRILNPNIKANPALLDYNPDYGLFVKRIGAKSDFQFIAFAVQTNFIAKVAEDQYTTLTVIPGDVNCMASFYFNERLYQKLLSLQPRHLQLTLDQGLRRMPYYVKLEGGDEFLFGLSATLSNEIIENNEESYIPFIVQDFMKHSYLALPDEDEPF
ncbi:MAG: HSDR-N-2 domain-containing protein [Serratia liquefaciens]|jgi:hypothetical protein